MVATSNTEKKKDRKNSIHYYELIKEAIVSLKDRTGSSVPAIEKYIKEKYPSLPIKHFMLLKVVKQSVANGKLTPNRYHKNSYQINKAGKSDNKTEKKVVKKEKKSVEKKVKSPSKKSPAKKAPAEKKVKSPSKPKNTVKKTAAVKKTAPKKKVDKKEDKKKTPKTKSPKKEKAKSS